MKNSIKIIAALKQAFPGHEITSQHIVATCKEHLYLDGAYFGLIESDFFIQDLDNPEIEIKIKAPLYNIKDFLEEVECDGVFYRAVERGLKEWEEGSRANN